MRVGRIAACKAALPHTLPVLAGYLFFGAAYGILMQNSGFGLGWTMVMSILVYAGAMQFIAVGLLVSPFNFLYVLLLSLMVNARHLFYGVSMLEKYAGSGWKKPFLAFWLTDETFSILCATQTPPGIDGYWFRFFVSMLHYSYWLAGSFLGNLFGQLAGFNGRGADFVMTALFTVIFINQWRSAADRRPGLIGVGASLLCLLLLGSRYFLIPAMLAIALILTLLRKHLSRGKPAVPES